MLIRGFMGIEPLQCSCMTCVPPSVRETFLGRAVGRMVVVLMPVVEGCAGVVATLMIWGIDITWWWREKRDTSK